MPNSAAEAGRNNNEGNNRADYVARGMASEAMQLFHSHSQLDDLRFAQQLKSNDEIKELIEGVSTRIKEGLTYMDTKIEKGFRSYDNKFWTLAISILGMLSTAVAALVFHLLTQGH